MSTTSQPPFKLSGPQSHAGEATKVLHDTNYDHFWDKNPQITILVMSPEHAAIFIQSTVEGSRVETRVIDESNTLVVYSGHAAHWRIMSSLIAIRRLPRKRRPSLLDSDFDSEAKEEVTESQVDAQQAPAIHLAQSFSPNLSPPLRLIDFCAIVVAVVLVTLTLWVVVAYEPYSKPPRFLLLLLPTLLALLFCYTFLF